MSGSWSQPGFQQYPQNIARHISGHRPPICFNCGEEGHFMVACQKPRRSDTIPFQTPPASQQQYPGPGPMPTPQGFSQQPGPTQTPYQQYPQNQQYGPPNLQAQQPYQYTQGPPQQAPQPTMPPQQTYIAPQVAPYSNQSYPPNQYPNNSGPQQFGPPPQQIHPQYNNPQPSGPQLSGPQPYGPPQPQQYVPNQGSASFQGQPVSYQTPQQNGSFNSRLPTGSSNFQGPAQQQWNNNGLANRNAQPPFQRQQRNYTDSSNPSGAPVFQGQQQHGRSASQQSNQRSNGNSQQQTTKEVQLTIPASAIQSKASSTANTPRGERESTTSSVARETNPQPSEAASRANPISGKAKEESKEVSEAAEAQQFEWDLEKIFKAPGPHEIVALAQPLSHDYDLTPVPQLNPDATCKSRYATKDNIKEFTSSVRDTADWPSRQGDPVFSELNLDSRLIPVDEVLAWTEARHAAQNGDEDTLMNDDAEASRKRSRSRGMSEDLEDGQNDVDTQSDREKTPEEENATSQPNKRQKTESGENANGGAGTPEMTTMFYEARDGTPSFATDDEAWAPQPGESAAPAASADPDPTEALLASLGVTGSPKPFEDPYCPLPPYQPLPEASSRPTSSGTNPSPIKKKPPTPTSRTPSKFQGKVAPTINGKGNMQVSKQSFKPTPPRVNPPIRQQQFGPSGNGLPFQPTFLPDCPPTQALYQDGAPSNGQYVMSQNGPLDYGGNNLSGYQQNGNQVYVNNNVSGPPQNGNPMYGNSISGPPQNGNLMFNQNMQGPPQNGNPMYGQNMPGPGYQQANNPQYGPQANTPYFNGNAAYGPGPVPQSQPPLYGPGPNQNNNNFNSNFNGQQQPMQPPQFNNGPPNQHANGTQGNPQFNNQFNQQQYGQNMQNNNTLHHDSGYASAGGFGNGPAQNGYPEQQNPQAQSQHMQIPRSHDGLPSNTNAMNGHQSTNGNMNNDTQPAARKEMLTDKENDTPPSNGDDSGREDSPLSEDSKEILGLLDTKKKRGPKRPAPIIEAAYSRRW